MNDPMLLWGFSLFGAAVVFFVVEVFVPSAGVLAGLALLSAIGSVVSFFQVSTSWGLASTLAVVVLAPPLTILALKLWPDTPIGRMLTLTPDAEAAASAYEQETSARLAELESMLGVQGKAVTAMFPVGTVRLNGVKHEALAQGSPIDAGAQVRVVAVEENQLKVRAV